MRRERVVIMGGSIAGLTAAAALSKHFKEVIVLERDGFPEAPLPRRGTPHGWHVHFLLNAGRGAMEGLLPGLFAELEEAGGVTLDMGRDVRWYHYDDWKLSVDSGMKTSFQTRPFLEWHILRRVRALENVQLRYGVSVDAPIHEDGAVTGVTLRAAEGEPPVVLTADLVLDALGRASKSVSWFEQWGYQPPKQLTVDVRLAYASRFFSMPPGAKREAVLIYHKPPDSRGIGALFPVEGDRWLVTLAGYQGYYPPDDEEGWMAYAQRLEHPLVAQLVRSAEPIGPIRTQRYPRQHRWMYHKLKRLPRNYGLLGDAVCSFDPLFGQGMSVASVAAASLEALFANNRWSPAAFQEAVAAAAEVPWLLTSVEAFRYPECTGTRPPGTGLLQALNERTFKQSVHDAAVYGAFLKVMHLDASPALLVRPDILMRILKPLPAVKLSDPVAAPVVVSRSPATSSASPTPGLALGAASAGEGGSAAASPGAPDA